MNWCEFITGFYEAHAQQPGIAGKPRFYPAARPEEIADAEARRAAKFPPSFESLLLQTNGVIDMMSIDGGEWFDSMWLLSTVAEIVEQNLFYRGTGEESYDRDFCQLVFFAGAGADGILFGFPVTADHVCAPRVVVWHPIEDELEDLTPSLEDFLSRWLTGKISV